LMRAKYVLCPPNTPGCLFPAMAKYDDTSAVLMETSDIRKPSDFFAIVGYREHVHVVQVNPQDMPDLVQATNTPKQPKTSKGTPAAEEYIQINVDTDGEGFPIGTTPPPLIPASTTIPLSAKDVLNKLSPNLINPKNPSDMSPTETDPLATNIRNEIIPGPGTIATALDKGLPLNINYLIPKEEIAGGTPHLVSQQLGWDGNVGMRTRPLNEGNYIFQSQLRKASIKRIYDINHEAKSDALQEEKVELNPMLRLELYCPSSPEILKVRDPFYKRMGGLSDKYTKRLLNRLKKGEASMNKVRIPAHEFKFSSPEDMVKLCDKHKETSHDDDPSARRTMSDQRSLERRRRAAIIHAQAKAKNRPIQIRRVVETENTGRHSR